MVLIKNKIGYSYDSTLKGSRKMPLGKVLQSDKRSAIEMNLSISRSDSKKVFEKIFFENFCGRS